MVMYERVGHERVGTAFPIEALARSVSGRNQPLIADPKPVAALRIPLDGSLPKKATYEMWNSGPSTLKPLSVLLPKYIFSGWLAPRSQTGLVQQAVLDRDRG